MPSYAYTVGVNEQAPTVIEPDPYRTAITVQNLDATVTDYLWISDQPGQVVATGLRIAAAGGSVALYQTDGWDTTKAWYLVATTAATPVRVLIGLKIPQVQVIADDNDDPQDPNSNTAVWDAPLMRRRPRR